MNSIRDYNQTIRGMKFFDWLNFKISKNEQERIFIEVYQHTADDHGKCKCSTRTPARTGPRIPLKDNEVRHRRRTTTEFFRIRYMLNHLNNDYQWQRSHGGMVGKCPHFCQDGARDFFNIDE